MPDETPDQILYVGGRFAIIGKPDPNTPPRLPHGVIDLTPGRPIKAIIADLNAELKKAGIEFGENEWSEDRWHLPEAERNWPDRFYDWIACYPVTGSNEGYYIHLELRWRPRDTAPPTRWQALATAKTWSWASACEVANHTSRLMGA